jgi:hypothetical protein
MPRVEDNPGVCLRRCDQNACQHTCKAKPHLRILRDRRGKR